MPHVIDDTNGQEYSCPTSEYEALSEWSRVLPASRRGPGTLLAALRRMLFRLRRLRPIRTPQEPEMSIDTLARKYPDIYRWITSWSC
jgi:hypothetical protein